MSKYCTEQRDSKPWKAVARVLLTAIANTVTTTNSLMLQCHNYLIMLSWLCGFGSIVRWMEKQFLQLYLIKTQEHGEYVPEFRRGCNVRPCTFLHIPARPCASLRVPARPCASLRVPARPCASLRVPDSKLCV